MITLSLRQSGNPSGSMPVKSTDMAKSTCSDRYCLGVDLGSAAAIAKSWCHSGGNKRLESCVIENHGERRRGKLKKTSN